MASLHSASLSIVCRAALHHPDPSSGPAVPASSSTHAMTPS
jgi:hypothetical protein